MATNPYIKTSQLSHVITIEYSMLWLKLYRGCLLWKRIPSLHSQFGSYRGQERPTYNNGTRAASCPNCVLYHKNKKPKISSWGVSTSSAKSNGSYCQSDNSLSFASLAGEVFKKNPLDAFSFAKKYVGKMWQYWATKGYLSITNCQPNLRIYWFWSQWCCPKCTC